MTEDKKAKLKDLQNRLKALTPEQRQELANRGLIATIEGRTLSLHNTLLCYVQSNPAQLPTIVGGFKQWLKANRVVSKGQHGLTIWFPAGKTDTEDNEEVTTFYTATVFDISQTEELQQGKVTPEAKQVTPIIEPTPQPKAQAKNEQSEDNVMAGFRLI